MPGRGGGVVGEGTENIKMWEVTNKDTKFSCPHSIHRVHCSVKSI